MDKYDLMDAIQIVQELINKQGQDMSSKGYMEQVHYGARLTAYMDVLATLKRFHGKEKSDSGLQPESLG